MAHFAVICPDDAGHLLSVGPIGCELIARGHRVTVLARERARPIAQRLGLPLHVLDMDQVPRPRTIATLLALAPLGLWWAVNLRNVLTWRAEAILRLVPKILKDLAVDGVIVDQTLPAGGTAAQRAGLPFVTICSALLWYEEPDVPPTFTPWKYREDSTARWRNRLGYAAWHWFVRPIVSTINRHRRDWNLPPLAGIEDTYSPLAQISQLCPGFDFPRRRLPDCFHYIGSLATDRKSDNDPAFPWDRLDGRPLIYASLGTVPYRRNVPVFRKILQACDGLDAQLVLALGRWMDKKESVRDQLGTIPANAIVVDFAPQVALLDKASMLITHAGVNTVLESLCRGVPMVALPRAEDQLGMGSRVEHAGAGLLASFSRSTPQQLRQIIQRVLADGSFRRRAQEIGQSVIACGGSRRAAEIAEAALTSSTNLQ